MRLWQGKEDWPEWLNNPFFFFFFSPPMYPRRFFFFLYVLRQFCLRGPNKPLALKGGNWSRCRGASPLREKCLHRSLQGYTHDRRCKTAASEHVPPKGVNCERYRRRIRAYSGVVLSLLDLPRNIFHEL
jgi:hypothetical protein